MEYLENEHARHCVPSNISSGLATLPLDFIYDNGTSTGVKTTKLSDEEAAVKEFKGILENQTMFFNDQAFPANESDKEAFLKCNSMESARQYCPTRYASMRRWFDYVNGVLSALVAKLPYRMFYYTGDKRSTPNCPVLLVANFNPATGSQSYSGAGITCGRACHYRLPFFLKDYGPKYNAWSVAAHEARPGHHTQVQGFSELFSDKCGGVIGWLNGISYYTAFTEGWALYAENPLINSETDTYSDQPLQKYGMLKWQIWRALRLIMDTGLHYKDKLDGRKAYKMILPYFTTTDMSPDEIHQLGWDMLGKLYPEAVRIAQEITEVNIHKLNPESVRIAQEITEVNIHKLNPGSVRIAQEITEVNIHKLNPESVRIAQEITEVNIHKLNPEAVRIAQEITEEITEVNIHKLNPEAVRIEQEITEVNIHKLNPEAVRIAQEITEEITEVNIHKLNPETVRIAQEITEVNIHKLNPESVRIAQEITELSDEEAAVKEFKGILENQTMFFNDQAFPANESDKEAFLKCNSMESARQYCPTRYASMRRWFDYVNGVLSALVAKLPYRMFYYTGDKRSTPNCPVLLVANFNPATGSQSYSGAGITCGRACHYRLPFFLKDYGPKYNAWSVAAHEARPGHHTQVQGFSELFSDKCGGVIGWLNGISYYTAFTEGWALYAENPLINSETDTYSDQPLQKYGMLKWQIWRALRLIMDTGLHYKEGHGHALQKYDKTSSKWTEGHGPALQRYDKTSTKLTEGYGRALQRYDKTSLKWTEGYGPVFQRYDKTSTKLTEGYGRALQRYDKTSSKWTEGYGPALQRYDKTSSKWTEGHGPALQRYDKTSTKWTEGYGPALQRYDKTSSNGQKDTGLHYKGMTKPPQSGQKDTGLHYKGMTKPPQSGQKDTGLHYKGMTKPPQSGQKDTGLHYKGVTKPPLNGQKDTGMHYKGMTKPPQSGYKNRGLHYKDKAIKDVTRYQSDPGQATAYMIGQLAIWRYRNHTEQRLQEENKMFNEKEFHFQVLSQGASPLSYLESHLQKYTECLITKSSGCDSILNPPFSPASYDETIESSVRKQTSSFAFYDKSEEETFADLESDWHEGLGKPRNPRHHPESHD
ncbi:predicted protein [Nematostella vectensis]|uniref:Uncharacterized protein n=1 Tax=Nematostella vectensis TaxID=45351 RepID=A7S2H1_NEMVE|nr:predicted protein [Nematostella vectensis]|eukprot:XP_001634212.1 predicted protein [Nematostella vectensis]